MILTFLHHPSHTRSIFLFPFEPLRKLKMPAQRQEVLRSQHNVPTQCGISWNSQPENALPQLWPFVPGTQQGLSQTLPSLHNLNPPAPPAGPASSLRKHKESEDRK